MHDLRQDYSDHGKSGVVEYRVGGHPGDHRIGHHRPLAEYAQEPGAEYVGSMERVGGREVYDCEPDDDRSRTYDPRDDAFTDGIVLLSHLPSSMVSFPGGKLPNESPLA